MTNPYGRKPIWRAASALLLAVCIATGGSKISQSSIQLPNSPEGLRFAVIGDTGTGDRDQRHIGDMMAEARQIFPFSFVLMAGDNMYGGEDDAGDFKKKFEKPYKRLLDAGVSFHAALGNHDRPSQRF